MFIIFQKANLSFTSFLKYCKDIANLLVSCSSVSVVDFEQVNPGWVLVIVMTRFLLTNDFFN